MSDVNEIKGAFAVGLRVGFNVVKDVVTDVVEYTLFDFTIYEYDAGIIVSLFEIYGLLECVVYI